MVLLGVMSRTADAACQSAELQATSKMAFTTSIHHAGVALAVLDGIKKDHCSFLGLRALGLHPSFSFKTTRHEPPRTINSLEALHGLKAE